MTEITVIAEDIEKAHVFRAYAPYGPGVSIGWACDCPIAYAIKRALPNSDVFVTFGLIQWRASDKIVTKAMRPDPDTKKYILRWDMFKDAEPGHTFNLEDHSGKA